MSPREITVTNGRRLDGWVDGRKDGWIGGVKVRVSADAWKPSADIVDSLFHRAARELRVDFHGHYKIIFVHPVCLNGNPYPFWISLSLTMNKKYTEDWPTAAATAAVKEWGRVFLCRFLLIQGVARQGWEGQFFSCCTYVIWGLDLSQSGVGRWILVINDDEPTSDKYWCQPWNWGMFSIRTTRTILRLLPSSPS